METDDRKVPSAERDEAKHEWFWRRLEQAERDFHALPAWMRKRAES